MTDPTAFTLLPDLASRDLAGSVVSASDELFAERENLIKPGPAEFAPDVFGPKGKTYDGWETRRRREPGHDHAIVRLGVPGIVRGVVVDTSWFTGNYPPQASVEATSVEGYPSPEELADVDWVMLVPRSDLAGDSANGFPVTDGHRFTHVRLSIYPDGGVARFRVHGEPVPDPRLLTGTVDLAALENGAAVLDCSNDFYSSPTQLLLPGRARRMGDGWENARRRDDGNDHVTVRLAAPGRVRRIEVDTSYFVGNAPGWVRLRGRGPAGGVPGGPEGHDSDAAQGWVELVPRVRAQPDTRHLFRMDAGVSAAMVDQVRLDVYPDGGIARLRVHGEVDPDALADAVARWVAVLPEAHATQVLAEAGVSDAARVLAAPGGLPDDVVAALLR
jgi:allantoicase